jgi:hypothetical protein
MTALPILLKYEVLNNYEIHLLKIISEMYQNS